MQLLEYHKVAHPTSTVSKVYYQNNGNEETDDPSVGLHQTENLIYVIYRTEGPYGKKPYYRPGAQFFPFGPT